MSGSVNDMFQVIIPWMSQHVFFEMLLKSAQVKNKPLNI